MNLAHVNLLGDPLAEGDLTNVDTDVDNLNDGNEEEEDDDDDDEEESNPKNLVCLFFLCTPPYSRIVYAYICIVVDASEHRTRLVRRRGTIGGRGSTVDLRRLTECAFTSALRPFTAT